MADREEQREAELRRRKDEEEGGEVGHQRREEVVHQYKACLEALHRAHCCQIPAEEEVWDDDGADRLA